MTSSYAFMGDFSGEIHVLKLSEDGLKLITVLKGHSGNSIITLFLSNKN